ncbi:hypothetical protein ATKI12_3115 [Kitasatospora sp. Ki12]
MARVEHQAFLGRSVASVDGHAVLAVPPSLIRDRRRPPVRSACQIKPGP